MRRSQPERWVENPVMPAALRDVLREARLERPSDAQLDRMIKAAGGPGSAVIGGSNLRRTVRSKALLGTACVATLGALSWVAWQASHRLAVQRVPSPPTAAESSDDSSQSSSAFSSEPRKLRPPRPPPEVRLGESPSQLEPSTLASPPSVAGTRYDGATTPALPQADARELRPRRPTPLADSHDSRARPPASDSDNRTVRPTSPHVASRDSRPIRPAEAAADPRAEVELLRRAKLAQGRDPAQAWQLLETHAQRYPRGMFTEEREALAVEALIALGRLPQARARAELLRARFPSSPYMRRIDALLP